MSSWLPGGFLGVDVFFVISGYLITMLMLEEHHRTGAVSVRGFYRRRARRLLPALFVLLLAVCSVAALFYREEMARLRAQVLSALTYSTNWYLIFTDGSYFDSLGRPLALRHLWSLAVEEQFYLLWPLVMVFLLRRFRDRLGSIALIIGALAGASAVWMALLYEPGTDPSRLYYGTDTRLATLLMGGLLAHLLAAVGPGPRRPCGGTGGSSTWSACWRWRPSCGASSTPRTPAPRCTGAASRRWPWCPPSPSPPRAIRAPRSAGCSASGSSPGSACAPTPCTSGTGRSTW